MFSRSIAHCSRRHTCVKEEHGIRGLNEIDRLSARTYIPPNLSCFYMPRHDRFLFIIEGTSQENYWISVPRLQWNSRPRVSIPPPPFLSNDRIREKFAYPRLRSENIAVDHGVCHVLLWVVLLLFSSFYTARKRFRDMTKFDFYSLPRLSLTASEISSFLRGMRNIDEFEKEF